MKLGKKGMEMWVIVLMIVAVIILVVLLVIYGVFGGEAKGLMEKFMEIITG